jgi:hypothetical protein
VGVEIVIMAPDVHLYISRPSFCPSSTPLSIHKSFLRERTGIDDGQDMDLRVY